MAMCLVTFDHEALGHGGMCLALGGHIRILTSSIFRCDIRSVWIDPAGPFCNCLVGAALAVLPRLSQPAYPSASAQAWAARAARRQPEPEWRSPGLYLEPDAEWLFSLQSLHQGI